MTKTSMAGALRRRAEGSKGATSVASHIMTCSLTPLMRSTPRVSTEGHSEVKTPTTLGILCNDQDDKVLLAKK